MCRTQGHQHVCMACLWSGVATGEPVCMRQSIPAFASCNILVAQHSVFTGLAPRVGTEQTDQQHGPASKSDLVRRKRQQRLAGGNGLQAPQRGAQRRCRGPCILLRRSTRWWRCRGEGAAGARQQGEDARREPLRLQQKVVVRCTLVDQCLNAALNGRRLYLKSKDPDWKSRPGSELIEMHDATWDALFHLILGGRSRRTGVSDLMFNLRRQAMRVCGS